VLYLVGETPPAALNDHPFVIYQNIYPPLRGCHADLLLPAAAFSEEEGTLLNHAGRLQEIHRSVPPPGEALPAWEIICRIARKMGAPGFDYASAADIRREIASTIPGFQPDHYVDLSPVLLRGSASQNTAGAGETCRPERHPIDQPAYMGFPLTQWVAGLRQLYPDESRRDHV
jgi:anaerobic selenocysteine-containing dehydrogenase